MHAPAHSYRNAAYIFICIAGVCFILVSAKVVFMPLMFAMLFSVVLLPLAMFLEYKLKFKRVLAAASSVLVLLLVLIFIFYNLASQVRLLLQDLPQQKAAISRSLQPAQQWLNERLGIDIEDPLDFLHNQLSQVAQVKPSTIAATLISVTSVILFAVLFIFETFFLLLYRRIFMQFLTTIAKKRAEIDLHDIINNIKGTIAQYIKGLLFEMIIVMILCSIGYWLTGNKYALLMGLIAGLLNIIPYAGIYAALVINLLIRIGTDGHSSLWAIIVITLVVHFIDSNILLPYVVGSRIRINPLITLLGLAIGAVIWGAGGMFLAIPSLAVVKIVSDRIEHLKPLGMLLGDGRPGILRRPFARRKTDQQRPSA